jgi:type IV pilus assembly protein PilE
MNGCTGPLKPIICAPCPAAPTAPPSQRFQPRRGRLARGFTLIELMITVSVAGILSGVAYPSFMSQVQKVRRSDALLSMMQVQWAQERWRANHSSYGSLAEIGVAATSSAGHYGLQLVANEEGRFEVIAAATGAQARDAQCSHLRLAMEGAQVVYTSGSDTRTNNTTAVNRQCWSL